MHSLICVLICVCLWFINSASLAEERFPPPEFRAGHVIPSEQYPLPAAGLVESAGYRVAGWCAWGWRRGWCSIGGRGAGCFCSGDLRGGVVWVCTQGVCLPDRVDAECGGGDCHRIGVPWVVGVFFALPLVVVLFFGRVFCSAVCPLGRLQDLFVWKNVQVPRWVEVGLGLLAYLYLGLAVVVAACGGPY